MRILASIAAAIIIAAIHAGATEIGVFAGPGCAGVQHLATYRAWLGSPAFHVTENFDQSSWTALASDATWSINCYAQCETRYL